MLPLLTRDIEGRSRFRPQHEQRYLSSGDGGSGPADTPKPDAIFGSHARTASGGREITSVMQEMPPARTSRPCLQKWGWGFSRRHRPQRATTMGSHAENFFPLFDF